MYNKCNIHCSRAPCVPGYFSLLGYFSSRKAERKLSELVGGGQNNICSTHGVQSLLLLGGSIEPVIRRAPIQTRCTEHIDQSLSKPSTEPVLGLAVPRAIYCPWNSISSSFPAMFRDKNISDCKAFC